MIDDAATLAVAILVMFALGVIAGITLELWLHR